MLTDNLEEEWHGLVSPRQGGSEGQTEVQAPAQELVIMLNALYWTVESDNLISPQSSTLSSSIFSLKGMDKQQQTNKQLIDKLV